MIGIFKEVLEIRVFRLGERVFFYYCNKLVLIFCLGRIDGCDCGDKDRGRLMLN